MESFHWRTIRERVDQGKASERERHGGDRLHHAGKELNGYNEKVYADIESVKDR